MLELIEAVNADIGACRAMAGPPEFPISTMSRALALRLGPTALAEATKGRALDVGTGCGIHAAIMAAAGFEAVDAIDVTPLGVECAAARWSRLKRTFPWLAGAADPTFAVDGIDEIAARAGSRSMPRYDLISFNPPGFFTGRTVDRRLPLDAGLYSGAPEEADDPSRSLLARCLKGVVGPLLKPGGLFLCTWPGLERRMAHGIGDAATPADEPVLHPVQHLDRWLGWSVAAEDADAAAFFRFKGPLAGYPGAADDFERELEVLVTSGRVYSKLVDMNDPDIAGGRSFRFGLMLLRRDRMDPGKFVFSDQGSDLNAPGSLRGDGGLG